VGLFGPSRPTVRPTTIGLHNGNIVRLVWSQWGTTKAVGHGAAVYCYTGCGAGATGPQRSKSVPVTVTLSSPVDTTWGWLFNVQTVAGMSPKPWTETVGPAWSEVVLPTPGNLTGTYLWSASPDYFWLELTQSGSTLLGEAGDGTGQYSVSGVATTGRASLLFSGSSSYSVVFDLVGVDLRAETPSWALITLVPVSRSQLPW
jgi:hypothetical protein